MVGAFSENKSGFVIVNEVEHGGNDTATLRSFRPLLKILYGLFPFPGGDAVPEDILSCRGSVLLCFSSLAHLDGAFWGIVFFPLFLAIRFSGNDSLREWRRLPAPRGQRKTVISLFWAASGR